VDINKANIFSGNNTAEEHPGGLEVWESDQLITKSHV